MSCQGAEKEEGSIKVCAECVELKYVQKKKRVALKYECVVQRVSLHACLWGGLFEIGLKTDARRVKPFAEREKAKPMRQSKHNFASASEVLS